MPTQRFLGGHIVRFPSLGAVHSAKSNANGSGPVGWVYIKRVTILNVRDNSNYVGRLCRYRCQNDDATNEDESEGDHPKTFSLSITRLRGDAHEAGANCCCLPLITFERSIAAL
jgi:hypothetical protein